VCQALSIFCVTSVLSVCGLCNLLSARLYLLHIQIPLLPPRTDSLIFYIVDGQLPPLFLVWHMPYNCILCLLWPGRVLDLERLVKFGVLVPAAMLCSAFGSCDAYFLITLVQTQCATKSFCLLPFLGPHAPTEASLAFPTLGKFQGMLW
jgi:hypothetical protein